MRSELWGESSKALAVYCDFVQRTIPDPGDAPIAGPYLGGVVPPQGQPGQPGYPQGQPGFPQDPQQHAGVTTGQMVGIGVGSAAVVGLAGAGIAYGVHQHNQNQQAQLPPQPGAPGYGAGYRKPSWSC